VLAVNDRTVLMQLLDGNEKISVQPGQKITIYADKVTCRASNIEITAHSCDLTFGSHNVALAGRRAHELFATLAEVGVPPDGAAGSIFEAVSNLKCTIESHEVKQNSGGGAECHYAPPN
jgi:hypothetical protein